MADGRWPIPGRSPAGVPRSSAINRGSGAVVAVGDWFDPDDPPRHSSGKKKIKTEKEKKIQHEKERKTYLTWYQKSCKERTQTTRPILLPKPNPPYIFSPHQ